MLQQAKFSTTGELPRVCQLVHSLNVGGAEILAERFSRRLGGADRVVFACLDEVGTLGQRLRDESFTLETFGRRPGLDLACAWRLSQFFRRHNVRLVHAHQYTPFFYAALSRLFGGGPRILFTEHGRFFPDRRSWKRALLNPLLLRRSDRVTAVGQCVADALVDNEGLSRKRIEVVLNGVDPDRFAGSADTRQATRAALGLSTEDVAILFVARLDPIKDHATAIRAMRLVLDRCPRARLLLAGDGPERSRLEALIAELGLAGKVTLLGMRRDIPQLLAAADLFLLTSVSEGIPLTIIEAMSAGLPIVATRVGGLPEVVEDGQTGRLAPAGDAAAIANAIVDLATDAAARHRMAASARQVVQTRFTEETMVLRYDAIYREILGENE